MPCMCGDTMCPSCGSAQGYDPAFEKVCEWFEGFILADFPAGFDHQWLAEEIVGRLDRCSPALLGALMDEAESWARLQKQKRRVG